MINIAICEDDFSQRVLLNNSICSILSSQSLDYTITEFSSGEELIRDYPNRIDILFLDIQMDKLTGMDTARKIREFDSRVEIIFTTAMLEYIHEGYEVRAYRYLLKPLNYEDLLKHVNSCINDVFDKNETIVIKDKNETIVILIDNILFIEVFKKEITIYTEDRNYTFKMSMKNIEKELLKKNFFRCHKSFLINLKKVRSLKQNIITVGSSEIPVSRYRFKDLKFKLVHILGDTLC